MPRKPLIVYVSGAPGSGKTTLAAKLSAELYIPHVSSDLVHGGVRLTEGRANDRLQSLFDAFIPTMIDMTKKGISFTVDQVLLQGTSEADIIDKLLPHAEIILVQTQATNPIERHLSRELARTDRGQVLDRDGLKKRAEHHRQNLPRTQEPVDRDLPTIIVNTDDGYSPSISDIANFIDGHYPLSVLAAEELQKEGPSG